MLVLAVIALMVIPGCTGGGGKVPINVDYRTGTKGVEMTFLKNAPPDQVLDGIPVNLGIQLENKGAADVEDGILVLTTEQDYLVVDQWMKTYGYMEIDENRIQFSLTGITEVNPKGERTIATARGNTLDLEPQTETHTTTIIASCCYPYKTLLSDSICVDTDLYDQKSVSKVCKVTSKSYSSQGAPIAVTRIDTLMLQSDVEEYVLPQFSIRIDNVGKGTPYDSERTGDACSSYALLPEEVNVVKVKAALDGKALSCIPEKLKLRGEGDTVRCTLAKGMEKQAGNYVGAIVVELDYGYMSTISKKVEIRRQIE
jgi:hypothetical protein